MPSCCPPFEDDDQKLFAVFTFPFKHRYYDVCSNLENCKALYVVLSQAFKNVFLRLRVAMKKCDVVL
jgi:hypothetical protein